MRSLWRDTRFGFRLLMRKPGFTAVVMLVLGLGIGANTAIYSVVYATLLSPLPYHDPNQLVMVWSKIRGNRNSVAAGDYLDWKNESNVFQDLSASNHTSINLAAANHPEEVQGQQTTPGYITTIGMQFAIGRDFLPEEGEVGRDHEAILTYNLWKDRFGSDLNIVGRQTQMNGKPYTIVGVLDRGSADRGRTKIFVPLAFAPEQINHDLRWLLVVGRLKPGVTIEQAKSNMDSVTQHIAEVYPKSNKGWGASVEPLKNDFLNRDVQRGLWLLLGAVGGVLLIACANVANLLLARSTTRQKEVALRASIGASRSRLLRQFLVESLFLALLGGLVGIILGWALLKLVIALIPPFTLPPEVDVHISVPVLLFTLATTILAGVLFGCVPAWRGASLNLSDILKEGHSMVGASGQRLHRALVVTEFAIALSLLTGGGLAIHGLWNVAHVELGFRSDHLLTFSIPVPEGQMTEPRHIASFYHQVLDRMQALPGVVSASASEGIPLRGVDFALPFQIAGKSDEDTSRRPTVGVNMITPQYFNVFGIRMDHGRGFTDRDDAGSIPVVAVNEAFAKKYFKDVDPLMQQLLVQELVPGAIKFGPVITRQVVGVYQNVHNGGIKGTSFPEIDIPFWQSSWPQADITVRTSVDPSSLSKSSADLVQSIDPDLPIADVKTMDQIKSESIASDRFTAFLFMGFASVALILAAVGIYGVLSFVVVQRTQEIGLRMALGADSRRVLAMVLGEGMILAAIGLALGLVGSYFVGRIMHTLLYNVGTIDGAVYSTVAVILVFTALLACYVPASRAVKIDPIIALRQE